MPVLWIKELVKQFACAITEGVRGRGNWNLNALTSGVPGGVECSTLRGSGHPLPYPLGRWCFHSHPSTQSSLGGHLQSPPGHLLGGDWRGLGAILFEGHSKGEKRLLFSSIFYAQ